MMVVQEAVLFIPALVPITVLYLAVVATDKAPLPITTLLSPEIFLP